MLCSYRLLETPEVDFASIDTATLVLCVLKCNEKCRFHSLVSDGLKHTSQRRKRASKGRCSHISAWMDAFFRFTMHVGKCISFTDVYWEMYFSYFGTVRVNVQRDFRNVLI